MEATAMRYWRDLDEIKTANRVRGHHFFEASTMRFFRSRVLAGVIGGRYFITSEQFRGSGGYVAPRAYTVRECLPDGECRTVGEFQAYGSPRQARTAAAKLPAAQPEGGAA